MTSSSLPLFWDAAALREGGREAVLWDASRFPHLLVIGATGSGKTYAVKLLLGKITAHIPGAKAILCDYKADDFRFLAGSPRYYEFDGCTEGLNAFYGAFQARQRGDTPSRTFRLLVFDEWASYVSMLDKKEAEEAKRKLATLLMLGRSFNFHVLVSQQRADAAYFSTARDNFNIVVALGNLSRESRDMFFSGFKDEMGPVRRLGEGYMLTNGAELRHIQVPSVRNLDKLDAAIKRLVI
ncbi:hypothetical protein CE91St41_36870 [Oscillospiraceae bacterium]|nr:hypothetical protein CE91St40_36850 [Oscillospiraceae bacterium]BDF76798.1 hypothetical protein CE91St41_36870 [Oscillospiraceae bacterium]